MMAGARWAGCALLCLALAVVAEDAKAKLVEALDAALTEEAATKVMEPHLGDLKSLPTAAMEKVVMRQWWTLARELVAKSHTQQVDLSFSVRKAVRSLKDEADELLRTLNPKYGQAQQVSPAFQWAQNDTCIFLTIKYTVRWNAPGALEVTEPSVNMSTNSFNFSGLGKHSNNKYRYYLSLRLFDNINAAVSNWNAASVGKLSVTLRKNWARKWPRLLSNKKTKVSNMHVWMEMQEKMDSTLGGMSTASNSPVTCGMLDKLYCLGTDTCKKPDQCSTCPGKDVPNTEAMVCTGKPAEHASISFKDSDMDENQIGGEVKITKAGGEFDIDNYVLYFGQDETTKLTGNNGVFPQIGEATPIGADTEFKIPMNTALPETASHLLIFSKNGFGEYSKPGSLRLKDAVLPKGKARSVEFNDEDGEKGEVSGTVTIHRAENENMVEDYAIHWGKSGTRKISSSSYIREIPKSGKEGDALTHHIARSTKLPEGATHLLVFTKNEFGEHPSPTSVKVVDNLSPCQEDGADNCPAEVLHGSDKDPDPSQAEVSISVKKAKSETSVQTYVVYWGRKDCSEGGQEGAKNGHIKDLPVGESLDFHLPENTPIPSETTHILVFTKNQYGESSRCVSTSFEDNAQAGQKKEL